MFKLRARAFTLVELIVVVLIIAILAAVAVVGYTEITNRAQDSRSRTDLATVAHAVAVQVELSGGGTADRALVEQVLAAAFPGGVTLGGSAETPDAGEYAVGFDDGVGTAISEAGGSRLGLVTTSHTGATFSVVVDRGSVTQIETHASAQEALTGVPSEPLDPEPLLALTKWRSALESSSSSTAQVLVLGDSITEGTGTSLIQNRWQTALQSALRTQVGQPDGALYPYLPAWSTISVPGLPVVVTGTYGSAAQGGIGGKGLVLGATGKVTFTFTGTRGTMMYSAFSGSHGLNVSVDGGAAVPLSGAGTATPPQVETRTWDTGPLAPGVHTVVVTRGALSGTANPQVQGLVTYAADESHGVRILDSSRAGTTSTWIGDPTRAAGISQATQTLGGVDLVIIGYGTNDMSSAVTPAAYGQNIATMIARLRTDGFDGSVLLVAPHLTQGRDPLVWQSYTDQLEALTKGDPDVEMVSMRDYLPDVPTPYTDPAGLGYFADALHLSDAGNARMAQVLADLVGVS